MELVQFLGFGSFMCMLSRHAFPSPPVPLASLRRAECQSELPVPCFTAVSISELIQGLNLSDLLNGANFLQPVAPSRSSPKATARATLISSYTAVPLSPSNQVPLAYS